MITNNEKIINSFCSLEQNGESTEFLNQVSIIILNLPKEQGNHIFAEHVSDVYIKFSQNLDKFIKAYYKCGHTNLPGFLRLYLKNLFLGSYKRDILKAHYTELPYYENNEKNNINIEMGESFKKKFINASNNQLTVLDRLILYLRYDMEICDFDKAYLCKILNNSEISMDEICFFMERRRERIRHNDRILINRINRINYLIHYQSDKVFKYNLHDIKTKLFKKLWNKKDFYSVDDTSKILNISRYRVTKVLKKFAGLNYIEETELTAA